MYLIYRTKIFEKSFARLKSSGQLKPAVADNLKYAIDCLVQNKKLEMNFRDHALVGDYAGYRECHIKGDLLLIYKIKKDQLLLVLVDIGNHSYLFG